MKAWATGDSASITAAYDPAAVMMLGANILAVDAKELTKVIKGAIGIGNRYERIGHIVSYEAGDGDTYVATVIEVKSAAHPSGDPLIGFYRIRDGKVIRHVFMEAASY